MLLTCLGIIFLFLAILLINTMLFSSRQLKAEKTEMEKVETLNAGQRLSESIKLKTISSQDDSQIISKPFLDLHNLLETSYPKIHKTLKKK